jgi:hypothetical protein
MSQHSGLPAPPQAEPKARNLEVESALLDGLQRRYGDLIRTLLYEGYALFPYRRDALKNQYRWNFGVLVPPAAVAAEGREASDLLRAELLLQGCPAAPGEGFRQARTQPASFLCSARLTVCVICLQQLGDDSVVEHWLPLRVSLADLASRKSRLELFGEPIQSTLELGLARGDTDDFVLISLLVQNVQHFVPSVGVERLRERARLMTHSLLACHVLLIPEGARWVSPTSPPAQLAAAAGRCQRRHTWPTLLDAEGRAALCSPIIVGDSPRLAPNSPGPSFDGSEIDELLSLSVQALSEREKARLLADGDPRTLAVLERAHALSQTERAELHASRMTHDARARFGVGDRVRLAPRRGGDVWDLVLSGKSATVVGVDWDLDGKCHVSVTLDDDPGSDLGAIGAMAHRFYFSEDEVTLA